MKLIYLMPFFILLGLIATAAAVMINENERTEIDSSLSTKYSNEKLSGESSSKLLFGRHSLLRSLVPDGHSHHYHHSPHGHHHSSYGHHHSPHGHTPHVNFRRSHNSNHRHIHRQIHVHSPQFHHSSRHGHGSSCHNRPRIPVVITAQRLTTLRPTTGPSPSYERVTLYSTTQGPPTVITSTTTSTPRSSLEDSKLSGFYDEHGNFFDIDVRVDDD